MRNLNVSVEIHEISEKWSIVSVVSRVGGRKVAFEYCQCVVSGWTTENIVIDNDWHSKTLITSENKDTASLGAIVENAVEFLHAFSD